MGARTGWVAGLPEPRQAVMAKKLPRRTTEAARAVRGRRDREGPKCATERWLASEDSRRGRAQAVIHS